MSTMKETITDTAISLFYRKGYFATGIAEIAKGCDIQKASFYYHFPSKEHLLYAIHRKTLEDLTAFLKAETAAAGSTEEAMRLAVRAHVWFHLTRQRETFIASSELRGLTPSHYTDIVKIRDDYEAYFQEIIRRGIDEGLFVKEDVKILSYAILTLCTSGAVWFRQEGRMSVDDIAAIYENFILRGLRVDSTLLMKTVLPIQ